MHTFPQVTISVFDLLDSDPSSYIIDIGQYDESSIPHTSPHAQMRC